jgi:hypothetical protein
MDDPDRREHRAIGPLAEAEQRIDAGHRRQRVEPMGEEQLGERARRVLRQEHEVSGRPRLLVEERREHPLEVALGPEAVEERLDVGLHRGMPRELVGVLDEVLELVELLLGPVVGQHVAPVGRRLVAESLREQLGDPALDRGGHPRPGPVESHRREVLHVEHRVATPFDPAAEVAQRDLHRRTDRGEEPAPHRVVRRGDLALEPFGRLLRLPAEQRLVDPEQLACVRQGPLEPVHLTHRMLLREVFPDMEIGSAMEIRTGQGSAKPASCFSSGRQPGKPGENRRRPA